MTSDIVLWVPPRTSFVHLLRTVAASACASFDLSIDDIADIRLAITEAASQLLASRPDAGQLIVRLAEDGNVVRIGVTLTGAPRGEGNGVDAETSLGWQVLQALADDVRIVGDDSEVGITFAKPRPAGAADAAGTSAAGGTGGGSRAGGR